mmetsp:Transcript_30240/g.70302  ORF Transcript_30240/g.70302 Transcript_30240/m.70302 type:complete len:201 (+) Transcript_30240:756-1358(+)
MRLSERDVDGTNLLSLLPGKDVHSRPGWDPVRGHICGERLLHCAGDVHSASGRVLDEVRQVLPVVPVEAHTFKPTVECSGLVLPIRGEVLVLQYHVGQHHVAHVVPYASVDKLDAPLLGEVGADLVPNLFTALVNQVRQVFPGDLVGVHIKDTPRRGHIPRRGVPRSHVEDHVHVFKCEGATRVQQLVIAIGASKEGVIL